MAHTRDLAPTRRDHVARVAMRSSAGDPEYGKPQQLDCLYTERELGYEIIRGRVAIRFVEGVNLVSECFLTRVKDDGHMRRAEAPHDTKGLLRHAHYGAHFRSIWRLVSHGIIRAKQHGGSVQYHQFSQWGSGVHGQGVSPMLRSGQVSSKYLQKTNSPFSVRQRWGPAP